MEVIVTEKSREENKESLLTKEELISGFQVENLYILSQGKE